MSKTETVESDASTLTFASEFKAAHPLLISETLLLLQNYQTQREQHASSTGIPYSGLPPTTQKAVEHCQAFSQYSNREVVREIRQSMIRRTNGEEEQRGRGMVEWEMVQVGNLGPESTEEARALVASLGNADVDEEEVQRILDDLTAIRRFQSNNNAV